MAERALWREALVERMRREAQPPEKFSHQPRLLRLTERIAEGVDYDRDVVFAAVWVHDLGVFTGHRPEETEALRRWDSTAYTVAHAPDLLRAIGFPEAKIAATVECIRTHEAHGEPQSVEGAILRDADILEQLGAVAAMRTACKIGRDTRYVSFADAVATLERALEVLPSLLRFETGKSLAEPRIAALRMFLRALQAESEGVL